MNCGSVPNYYFLILHYEILHIGTRTNSSIEHNVPNCEDFSFNYLIFQALLKHINLMAVTDGESWMTLKLISWTLCIPINKQIQVWGQRQRHTDKENYTMKNQVLLGSSFRSKML